MLPIGYKTDQSVSLFSTEKETVSRQM